MKAPCSYWPNLPTRPATEKLDDGSGAVDCLCGVNFDDGKEMVRCDECDVWVHTRCALFIKGEPSFVCHKCKATAEKSIQEEQQSRLAYWRELDDMIWANLANTWATFAKMGVVLPPLHTFQEPITKLHIQEQGNQIEEEEEEALVVMPSPKHNNQEVNMNRKDEEEVGDETDEMLEEPKKDQKVQFQEPLELNDDTFFSAEDHITKMAKPKVRKHKAKKRRKKWPSRMKVNLRLKHTKKRKEKLSSRLTLTTPWLKRTTKKVRHQLKKHMTKKRRKCSTKASKKASSSKDLIGRYVNTKKMGSTSIENRTKHNEMKYHFQVLSLVQDRNPCLLLYQRCEIYKEREMTEGCACVESMGEYNSWVDELSQ